jgi:hypothetical protein
MPWVGRRKVDWRKWEDGKGNKVDAPGYRGAQFTGKIIPPLTDGHGNPIKDGSFQIVMDAKGNYVVIDWSLPVDPSPVTAKAEEDDGRTAPIMGRMLYRTRHSLDRAKAAMAILADEKKERAKGLPPDPAQCFDLKGAAIVIGKLALRQFQRGPHKTRYVIVNEAIDITLLSKRGLVIKERTLKDAVARLVKEAQLRKANFKPRKKFTGPPILFSAPEGFGGFGGDRGDRTCPTPDSKSWDVVVDLYARTGQWCQTAKLIWCGDYPQELIEQCEEYRQEYLGDPDAFYDAALPAKDEDYRESIESRAIARAILECFEGSYVAEPEASAGDGAET